MALVSAAAVGAFCGLLVCSYFDLGFSFSDLKQDVLKCVWVSSLAVIPAWVLLAFVGNPYVVVAFPAIWFVCVRLSWLELNNGEVVVLGVSTLLAVGVAAGIIALLLGRPGVIG